MSQQQPRGSFNPNAQSFVPNANAMPFIPGQRFVPPQQQFYPNPMYPGGYGQMYGNQMMYMPPGQVPQQPMQIGQWQQSQQHQQPSQQPQQHQQQPQAPPKAPEPTKQEPAECKCIFTFCAFLCALTLQRGMMELMFLLRHPSQQNLQLQSRSLRHQSPNLPLQKRRNRKNPNHQENPRKLLLKLFPFPLLSEPSISVCFFTSNLFCSSHFQRKSRKLTRNILILSSLATSMLVNLLSVDRSCT